MRECDVIAVVSYRCGVFRRFGTSSFSGRFGAHRAHGGHGSGGMRQGVHCLLAAHGYHIPAVVAGWPKLQRGSRF